MHKFADADLDQFLAEDPGGPVVMLNLLRFRPDGGRERYQQYVDAVRAIPRASDNAEWIYYGQRTRAHCAWTFAPHHRLTSRRSPPQLIDT